MNTKDYIKSLKITGIVLSVISIFVFLYSIQTSFGYSGTGTTQDLKSGSRINGDILAQPFNGSVTIYFGTQSTSPLGTGTVGYIGTNTAGLPKLRYSYTNGSSTVTFDGFDHVAINGSDIPLAGSVSIKLDAVGGVGTNNTFNNPTFAGVGTFSATLRVSGLDITPAEWATVNNATSELQSQINTVVGSTTNHAHTGSDGTTQVSHTNLTNKGTQTHPQIDDFIASKAQASGVASLDANSRVVQNPASGTSTPGIAKMPIALGTGFLDDSWLSSTISKLGADIQLGTETTGNTDNVSEGSTNQYYTANRVNAVIGSSSVGSRLNEQIISVADGHHFVYDAVLGKWKNATSTAAIGFDGITGVPSDNTHLAKFIGADTLKLPGTTTPLTGTGTSQRVYNLVRYADPIIGTNTTALMTSNTAPSPNIVSVSSENPDPPNTMEGYRAFDRLIVGTNRWLSNATETAWITYNTGTGTANSIKEYGIACAETIYAPKAWTFEGSNDNSTWSILDTQTNQTGWTSTVYRDYTPTVTGQYQFYRINISVSQGSGYVGMSEVRLIESNNNYTYNTFQIIPPGTTAAFVNIVDDGTYSTDVEIVLGSTTPYSSATVHVFQGIPASRLLFGFYDAYCFEASKDIIGTDTSVQDEAYAIAKRVNIVKSHPVDPKKKVTQADAINSAQEDYMNLFRKSDIETYKTDRIAEYTTGVIGSISVNLTKLNRDAQIYHENQRKAEFEVLPDLAERIRKKKKSLESDKNITSISIIADDASTDELLKGADNRTASIGNQIGVLFGAFQAQTDEIGSLTAALENQKVAYAEEVDNLYKWINAIIIAIVALGAGSGGWATLRNKRKGT